MTEPLDLEPYIEQVSLVPDGTTCTIDIEILRQFVEELRQARAERDEQRAEWRITCRDADENLRRALAAEAERDGWAVYGVEQYDRAERAEAALARVEESLERYDEFWDGALEDGWRFYRDVRAALRGDAE